MIAAVSMIFFVAASFLGLALFSYSAGEAKSKELDTLHKEQHRKASLAGFYALLMFPVLCLIASAIPLLSSIPGFAWTADGLLMVLDAVGALLVCFFVFRWAVYELIPREKNDLNQIADDLIDRQFQQIVLHLMAKPDEHHPLDALYNRSFFWLELPTGLLRDVAHSIIGPRERVVTGEQALKDFFSGLAVDKTKFINRVILEAQAHRITLFYSETDPSALIDLKMLAKSNTAPIGLDAIWVRYGDHRPPNFVRRMLDGS
jgi:hypothetical protein